MKSHCDRMRSHVINAINPISHAMQQIRYLSHMQYCIAYPVPTSSSGAGGGGGSGRDAKGMTRGGAHDGMEGGHESEEEGGHVTRREKVRRRRRMRALALFLTIALFVATAITLAALFHRKFYHGESTTCDGGAIPKESQLEN